MKMFCYILILNILLALTSAQNCPQEIELCSYASNRMEAADDVRESLVDVLSTVFNTTIDGSNDRELYETVSDMLGINATADGFVQFQEAVNEITVASSQECSKPASERIGLESVGELVTNFTLLLDAGYTSEAREIYGQLLCLNSLLQPANETSRKKRMSGGRAALKDFFDNLNGEVIEKIYALSANEIAERRMQSLAFVVDDTGSMSEEIDSVRRLIKSFVTSLTYTVSSYIYTTFNDPEVGVPMKYISTNTTHLTALVEAVNNTIAHGGGDCAELGMTGILNALSLSEPDSNVIVLTDAAPKDVNRTDEVIQSAMELHNSIHFFLSDNFCENDTEYVEVAMATGGIIVNSITDFEAFAIFANMAPEQLQFDSTETSNDQTKRQTDEVCIQFAASAFTAAVNVLVMAPGHILNITRPSGESVALNVSSSIGTYSDDTPQVGEYMVCSSMGDFGYVLSTPTALDFFVEYLEGTVSSHQPPPEGTPTTVLVSTSRLDDISMDSPINLSLINDGVEISTVPLMLCSGFLTGNAVIPNTTFQYQLRGTDVHGITFEQTSNRLVEATAFDERVVTQLQCPTPTRRPGSAGPLECSARIIMAVLFLLAFIM